MKQQKQPLDDNQATVLITGGTGLVGTALSSMLSDKGYKVTHLSRNPTEGQYQSFYWDVKKGELDTEAIKSADAIVHLAGAGVADKRWNKQRKEEIYKSRIDSTKLLREKVKELKPSLSYFLCASAIGYYGWDSGDQVVDEESNRGTGFLADVVADWEKEAACFDELNIARGVLRIGVVLSNEGGALVEIAKPIRLGAGAPLGTGNQYLSWIHIEDLCGIIQFMIEKKIVSAINGVAPNPETNRDFTKKLATQLKKPLLLPNVPKLALRLLVGEMADMLIGGNRVSSLRIEKKGYNFKFRTLEESLADLIRR